MVGFASVTMHPLILWVWGCRGKKEVLQLARDGAVDQGKQGKKGKEERAGP